MTGEELEKEAEKSLDKRLGTYAYIRKQDCYINYVDGYTDGALPREKRIAELEKENAELKKDKEELCHSISEGGKACVYLNDQLTEAKKLLKEWLQTSKASGCDNINIVTDTEQFISGVEK